MRNLLHSWRHLPSSRSAVAGHLLAGALIFAIALPGLAQPTVTVRNPVRNALAAPSASNVALTFSQAMNAATDQNLRVFSTQRGGRKSGVYSTVGSTITFNPGADFYPGERVMVVVPPSVTSGGGQAATKQVHEFWVAATSGTGGFSPAPTVTVNGAVETTLADLNNDSNLDLIVANGEDERLEVRMGLGNGSFVAGVNLPTALNQAEIEAADVDGDGDLDLLAIVLDNTVHVFKNNGDATFTAPVSVPVGQLPHALAMADIDGDGDLDMLVANEFGNSVSVRFNNGTGTFSGNTNVSTGGGNTIPKGIEAADMDGDADLDLIVANTNMDQVRLLVNNGAGTFALGAAVSVGEAPQNLKTGDLDGDGDLDVVVTGSNQPSSFVSVLLNNGSGSLTLDTNVTSTQSPHELDLLDVDADGDLDLLAAGQTTVLHRNNGQAGFGAPTTVVPTHYQGLTTGDLDHDGDLDFVECDIFTDAVIVRLNAPYMTVTGLNPTRNDADALRNTNVAVSFSANVLASTASRIKVFGSQAGGRKVGVHGTATNVVTFDPTTSFRPGEAVSVSVPAAVESTTGQIAKPHVYQFTAAATGGTGTFSAGSLVTASDNPYGVATGDVDGDGDLDMVVTNYDAFGPTSLTERFNNGDGTFSGNVDIPSGSRAMAVVLGDLDGDGDLDLVSGHNFPFDNVRVRLNDGTGTFGAMVVLPSNFASSLALGDVDGDGDLDLLAANNGSPHMSVFLNDGAAGFTLGSQVALAGLGFRLATGDVDNDGDLDLLITLPGEDQVQVRLNNGSGVFSGGSLVNVGDSPIYLSVGDLDGDGDADMVVTNSNNGTTSLSMRLNNGSGTFTGALTLTTTGAGAVALGDMDGDGDLDVYQVENAANTVRIYPNNGNATFSAARFCAVGANPQGLALGDLDNDGDLDLLATNQDDDNVSVRLNQDAFMVTGVSPTRNDADAARGADVAITFNKNVNNGTSNRIRVWGGMRGGKKAGVYSTNTNTITFNPTFSFAPGELVNVTVPTTVLSTGADVARKLVYQYRAAATGGQGTFTEAPDVAVSDISVYSPMTTADINGDGNLDLLIVSASAHTLTQRLGNGDGTFGAVVAVGTVQQCNSLVTADVDNDGDLDVLVGERSPTSLLVFLNNGLGTFTPGPSLALPGFPIVVAAGDLDGDGDLDMVSTSSGARFNNGSGVFSGPNATLQGSVGIALGDVDGDGDLDVVSCSTTGEAFVYRNNGNGLFSLSQTLGVGSLPNGVVVSDLDSDGDLDMAVVCATGQLVAVRLNDGTGQFGGGSDVPTGGTAYEMNIGDMDGDGDLDLLASIQSGPATALLLNHGDGTFTAAAAVAVPTSPLAAVGDVDNDGDLDLLLPSFDTNVLAVRLNDNAFIVTARTPERHTSTALTGADVNLTLSEAINPTTAGQLRVFGQQSSGRKGGVFAGLGTSLTLSPGVAFAPGELVNVTARATIKTVGNLKSLKPHVYQFRAKATGGTGTFTNAPNANLGASPGLGVAADVNGDGHLDLLVPNRAAATASIAFGAGDGTFGPAAPVAVGADPRSLITTDIDGDGDLDLITSNADADALSIRRNNGAGVFSGADEVAVGEYPQGVVAGDLDGDGDLDLVTDNFSGHSLSVCLNNGAGTFAVAVTLPLAEYVSDVKLGDVDNDGDLDLMATVGEGTVALLRNTGGATFGAPVTMVPPTFYGFFTLADMDTDGDLDLVLPGGNNQLLHVLRNDGTGVFGAVVSFPMGQPVFDATPADFDGDGDLDLVFNTNVNEVVVRLNNGMGGFVAMPSVAGSFSVNSLFTGDVDEDGDLDLLGGDLFGNVVNIRLNNAVAGPAPIITSFAPDHGVTGTVVTLTGTNFTGTTAVAFDGVAAPGFVVSNGGTTITVSSPPATFNGVISVTTPDGVASTATDFGVDLVITGVEAIPAGDFHHITVTPTGAASLGGAVEATSDVLVQTGGELADGGSALSGIGTFTLEPGATLRLRNPQGLNPTGALQLSGGLTLATGADYIYQATQAQVTGTNLPLEVRNLTIDNPESVALSQGTSIRQVLRLVGASDLSVNNQPLTLLSDINGTALVVNEGSGKVKGDATAQCYISAKSFAGVASHHLTSPVLSTTVADLATPGFVPVVNPAYNVAPNPTSIKPYPNVFGYDETRSPASPDFVLGYYSPTALADVLAPTRGYSVAIKGGLTPDFVGSLNTGDQTAAGLTRTGNFMGNTEKSGWHLLGNPYPSPLDWDLMTVPAGLSPSISVYSPTGANAGVYLTRANGLGTLPDGILPLGQGFFARVTGAGPVDVTFTNAARVTTFGTNSHYRQAAETRPVVKMSLRTVGASAQETDGAVVYFQEGATVGVDRDFDGERPAHNLGLPTVVSLTPQGEELAVNGLPETALHQTTRVPLLLDLPQAGTYELAVRELLNLPAGTEAALVDNFTGTRYELATQPVVRFPVQQAGAVRNRFALEIGTADFSPLPSHLSLYPNPAHGQVQVVGVAVGDVVRVFDSVGREVRTLSAGTTATVLSLQELPAGVYVVRAGGQTQRLVVK